MFNPTFVFKSLNKTISLKTTPTFFSFLASFSNYFILFFVKGNFGVNHKLFSVKPSFSISAEIN